MTITEFLLERISEDAASSAPRMSEINAGQVIGPGAVVTDLPHWRDEGGAWGRSRVLAECEAKRRIVVLHLPSASHRWCITCTDIDIAPPNNVEPYPCRTLRALASVYDTHPDHDDTWRP